MSIKLQNVCVPVDFSETSTAALKYGKALAEAFSAKLHLLHVLINWVPAGDFPVSPDFYKDLELSARKQLDAQLTADEVKKYQARLELVNGNSEFVEIIRYAKEQNIDLLVLGTHGRGPIAHMLMGSVAEKVSAQSALPGINRATSGARIRDAVGVSRRHAVGSEIDRRSIIFRLPHTAYRLPSFAYLGRAKLPINGHSNRKKSSAAMRMAS